MSRAVDYRNRAAEFFAQANLAGKPEVATELRELAGVYLRLADVADRNGQCDLVYEPPPPKLSEC